MNLSQDVMPPYSASKNIKAGERKREKERESRIDKKERKAATGRDGKVARNMH